MRFELRIALVIWGLFLVLLPLELLIVRRKPSEARLLVHSEFWHGDSDLYLRVPGSLHNTNLTRTSGVETHPTWSPDGQHIAFVTDRDTEPGKKPINAVYVMERDGSHPRKVGLSSPATGTRVISWSQTGDWLYLKYITQGWWDSNFIRFSDGHTATLRFDTTFTSYAAWSPDGSRLAYRTGMFDESETALGIATPNGASDIANTHIILTIPEYITFLTWSSDGQHIAFTTQERGTSDAPAPSVIAEVSMTPTTSGGEHPFHLYRVRADGTDLQLLFSSGTPFYQVTWSPLGDIIFTTWEGGHIYRVHDAEIPQPLTPESSFYRSFAWSPDGKSLAYVREDAIHSTLYRLENGQPHLLYSTRRDIFRVEWTPDSRRILFVEGEREQGQVYWLRPDGSDLQYLTDTAFNWDIPISPIIDTAWRGWLLPMLGLGLAAVGVFGFRYKVSRLSANRPKWFGSHPL